MTRADRLWLRKQLRRLREEIRDDTRATLSEVLNEEAQMVMLERMTQFQSEKPAS